MELVKIGKAARELSENVFSLVEKLYPLVYQIHFLRNKTSILNDWLPAIALISIFSYPITKRVFVHITPSFIVNNSNLDLLFYGLVTFLVLWPLSIIVQNIRYGEEFAEKKKLYNKLWNESDSMEFHHAIQFIMKFAPNWVLSVDKATKKDVLEGKYD